MLRSNLRATLAASLSFCAFSSAFAQEVLPPAPVVPGSITTTASGAPQNLVPLPPATLALRPSVRMTLQQAVALALERNFDIQNQKYSFANSQESLISARARFDPTITINSGPQIQGSKSTNSTTGVATYGKPVTWSNSGTLTQNLPTGGSYTLTVNPFNRSGEPRSYGTGLSFSANHPLLRGFGRELAQASLRNAELGLQSAANSYRARILDTVQSVENAYTALISQLENYEIRLRSEQISARRFEETGVRRSAGLVTDIDADTAYQDRLSGTISRIQAEQCVKQAEDTLRNLLGGVDFNIAIVPDAVADLTMPIPTEGQAYRLTLENSTDYQNRLLSIRQQEISLNSTKNNLRPQLNLVTGANVTGRDSDIGESWRSSIDRDNYSWNVGLQFTMNIGQHAEKSAYRSALNSMSSSRLGLRQLEQSILIQVRNALRTLDTAEKNLAISRISAQIAEKNLNANAERFRVGTLTQLALLQVQQTWEQALVSELSAKFSYRQAITALQRLQGTTLDRYGITLPSPDLPDIARDPR